MSEQASAPTSPEMSAYCNNAIALQFTHSTLIFTLQNMAAKQAEQPQDRKMYF